MENRGQKRMEDVEELPADKRACNSQDSRTSTSSDSSAQSQSQEAATNGASSGHENTDADMDTSSSDSPSSHSEGEQEKEVDDSDYGTCDSDDDDDGGGEDPRHQELQDIQYGRSSEDQQKLTSLVSRLSEEVDPSLQLIGLTELCEVLSFCTEDSFSTVMADALSRVLVKLANHESNADIMLLAIRAITYLSDVYPRSVAFLVKHETLPALCRRLVTIDYLDVAEQCLQALEKISKDDPVACLNAGAIKAVLSYIDFFSTSIQRVAVSTVVNICRELSSESPSPFMDAVPLLCNLLQYEDRQLVENVAICLTKIADQASQSPEILDQLCSYQLIHQSIHLLNLNGRTTLSQPVYNGVIGLLRKLSSGSSLAFQTLYELNIGYRLKEIISTYDISHSVSSTHANNTCSNQVHEVLKLVIELLPSSPVEDNQLALEKESFLVSQPDLLQQFGADILPVMIQVLKSGANVYVSYGCLSAIHKLTCLSKSADFIDLLKNANILSVLAGTLSRKDHHVVVVALQIAEVLLEKYRDAFLSSFIKEGVFFAIEALLNSDRGQQNPVSTDASQKPVPKEVVKCLCQSFERSISSSSQTCKIEKDSVYILATRIKERFFGPEVFDSQKGLTDVLQNLKHLSAALNDLMTVPIDAHALHDEKFFSIWSQIIERLNGRESVSTFEFRESGVVKALANYLSNGLHQRKFSKGDPECDSLPFVGNRFEVFTRLLWSDGEATSSVLIKKLQNFLSSSENYPIVLSQFLKQRNSFATVPNGRSTSYPILKVRFVKAEGETCLRDYSQDLVTVDPLCYLDAVDQHMWPKVHLKPLDSVEAKDQAMECQSSQLQSTSISCQGENSSHMEIDNPNASQGSQEEDQEQLTDSGEENASSSEEEDALANEDPLPRLLFRLEGVELDRSLTVYQAILLHRLKSASETTEDSKLSGTHTITYERAPQLADSHENPIPHGSVMDSGEYHPFLSYLFAHRLGLRHKATNPPAYDVLFLLKSLEGMNRYLFHLICHERINAFGEGRLENLDDLRVVVRPVPYAEFVSSKFTDKLEQQLRDSFALSTCGLPPWFNDLMGSCPFLFSFEVKSKYFRLAAFGSQKVHHHPQHLSSSNGHGEGRPATGSLPRKKFLANRENILESAAKMMELHGNQKVVIEVEYSEEVGTGLGPTLEFYTLASRAFQNPDLGMWRSDRSNSFAGKPKEDSGFLVAPSGLFPRPWSDTSAAFPDVLQKFVLLGTVVAKALHDGRVLDIPFSKAFYKLILGQELGSFDIHFIDPELCKTLVELQALARRKKVCSESQSDAGAAKLDLSFRGTKIEDLCLEFTLPGYSDYVLNPHSANDMVNMDNLEEYIKAIVNATVCNGIQKQVEAFRSGFNKVFPIEHLEIFNEEELETLLCGERDLFNMNEVLDHIKFDHGYTSSSPPVQNLLEIVHEFDKEQQRAFLQFVTGCPRLPPGGLASLNPKLTIVRKHGSDSSETDLPSVMTCANYLKLPPYTSKEKMKEKLIYAITEGQGSFHLS